MKAEDENLDANTWPINLLALRWLREAKAEATPSIAFLPQLAMWGLEQGLRTPEPLAPNHPSPSAVEQTIGLLLGVGKKQALRATEWFLSNPNLDRQEQQNNLRQSLSGNCPGSPVGLKRRGCWRGERSGLR